MTPAAARACSTAPLALLRACSSAAVGSRRQHAVAATSAAACQLRSQHHQQQQQPPTRRLLCSATAAAAAAETAPTSAAPAEAAAEQPAADAPHISVLLTEVLAAFEGQQVRRYVDGTLGAAGHAAAVLQQHPEVQTLVGFDLDPTAHQLATARLQQCGAVVVPVAVSPSGTASFEPSPAAEASGSSSLQPRPTAYLVRSNFGRLKTVLSQLPLGAGSGGADDGGSTSSSGGDVDAILLDLGVSSMQVDTADRGFSFLRDGPLDMRMDPGATLSAEQLVNAWPEAELGRIFREYGEERHWKGIARRIVSAREEEVIATTQHLVRAVGGGGGGGRGGGGKRGDAKYKHPATRVFQAIRIAVNGELQSIAQVLPDAIDSLAPGGRLAVITFHSLEDRIVKWAFRHAAGMSPSDEQLPSYCLPFEQAQSEASIKIITRRPLVPSREEERSNSRSRSAKLRVVEKL